MKKGRRGRNMVSPQRRWIHKWERPQNIEHFLEEWRDCAPHQAPWPWDPALERWEHKISGLTRRIIELYGTETLFFKGLHAAHLPWNPMQKQQIEKHLDHTWWKPTYNCKASAREAETWKDFIVEGSTGKCYFCNLILTWWWWNQWAPFLVPCLLPVNTRGHSLPNPSCNWAGWVLCLAPPKLQRGKTSTPNSTQPTQRLSHNRTPSPAIPTQKQSHNWEE